MIPTIEDIIAMLQKGECTPDQALQWIGSHIDMATEHAALRDHFASNAAVARDADGNLLRSSVFAVMGADKPESTDAAEQLTWWCTAEARIRYAKAEAMMEARLL